MEIAICLTFTDTKLHKERNCCLDLQYRVIIHWWIEHSLNGKLLLFWFNIQIKCFYVAIWTNCYLILYWIWFLMTLNKRYGTIIHWRKSHYIFINFNRQYSFFIRFICNEFEELKIIIFLYRTFTCTFLQESNWKFHIVIRVAWYFYRTNN